MLKENKQANSTSSAIERVKRRSMLKKQRSAIVIVSVVVALLIVAAFAVNYLIDIYVFADSDGTEYYVRKINGAYALCDKDGDPLDKLNGYYVTALGTEVLVDPSTGSCEVYIGVDIDGTEVLGYGQNVLMFKQLTYDMSKTKDESIIIKSIEVHNQLCTYTFERESGNLFKIKGFEGTPYDQNSFAQLAVACGYTISSVRLESPKLLPDGSVDYAEYGLAEEKRTKTELDENGNEIEIEYDYSPSWYVITTMSGDAYKVYIGDMAVTGDGYYARLEGRDRIYVLADSGFSSLVLQTVEKFVTPMLVYPTEQNTYFDVSDFIIYDKIDHDAISADIKAMFGSGDEKQEITEEEFEEIYSQLLEKNSHKICHLSYQNTVIREGTLFEHTPYISKLDYAEGYRINSDTVDNALYALYATEFTEVIKLSPTTEDLEKYGLYDAPYMILFYNNTTNSEGKTVLVENQVSISEKTDEGVFYAYSPFYDMIVGVSESSFGFLEYDELAWYETNYIRLDIAHVEEIAIESSKVSVHFRIDDSVSKYMNYSYKAGSSFAEGDNIYKVAKKDGKYILTSESGKLSQVYEGDFLVTPAQYTPGEDSPYGYMFYEAKQTDTNGDGEDDAIIVYYYNIYGTRGKYRLAAIKSTMDMAGNEIGESEVIEFDIQKSTEFFLKGNYIYITSRNTYIGWALDEAYMDEGKYGSNLRGSWGSGNVYTTADGQTILVNSENGEWGYLSGTSCGIFFAGKDSSRLAGRALKIPEIKENGKYKQYAEVYYPTTANDLIQDSNGDIKVIDKKTRETRAATYEDCTIGVWCKGAYYRTEGENLIAVNESTGDWGVISLVSNESYVAEIFANDTKLDYVITTTNHAGKAVKSTAMDNFKQFYGSLLYASFDGMADLSDEEKAALRQYDDFVTGENNCQLKITLKASDAYGERRDLVIRIYQYTERKSYITIESVSPEDGYASDSESAYGNFFVARSFADKIIEDAKRIMNGEEVVSDSKR